MPEDSDLFEDETITATTDDTAGDAEALSAPDDLSSAEGLVDQGSQAQPSDAAPTQNDYQEPQAPQIDPQWIGAAYTLGIQNPEQYAPEQLAHAIRARHAENQQQVAFARQMQGDWSAYEAWKREQAAGAQGRASAAAAEQPEPFDPQKHFEKAWGVPQPPAHLERLADHLVQTPTGRYIAKPGSEQLVSPQELEEVNAYQKAREEHLRKFLENPHKNIYETMQPAIDRLVEQRLEAAQREQAKAQFVQNFAAQVQHAAQDQHGNPTPYGQALMRSTLALKESGLDPQTKLQIAHNAAVGQLAMQSLAEQQRQQAYGAWYAQQYGQPQPQSFEQQPPAPQPQPAQPSFLQQAAHSAASAGGSAGKPRRPRNEAELQAQVFGPLLGEN